MRTYDRSRALFEQSKRYLAGGLTSNVRAGDQPHPLFFRGGAGSRLVDVDGNEYIDYVLGRGPLILGHSHPAIVEAVKAQVECGQLYAAQHELEIALSERLCRIIPCAEQVRYNVTGSEAVHAALRLARAFTGREKIVKFEGHYHGWFDNILFNFDTPPHEAGPAESPRTVAVSRGQTSSDAANVIVLPWNDPSILQQTVEARKDEIAAIIMEPAMCNMGLIMPRDGYLAGVRELCTRHGILLIFDEVITGFRLSLGGTQGYFHVTPDLAVFGKALASGFPLSCLAGKRHIMELISEKTVMHAGTFNGHPVCMAAALSTIQELERRGESVYEQMDRHGKRLAAGIQEQAKRRKLPLIVQSHGAIASVAFMTGAAWGSQFPTITDYRTSCVVDKERYNRFVGAMADHGVRLVPGGVWFLSAAHTEEDIEQTLAAVDQALDAIL